MSSTATPEQTRDVAAAAERTYAAYIELFGSSSSAKKLVKPLQLRLYRDSSVFHAKNRGPQWAEAYYLAPVCHAYYSANEVNPLHWMVHESVHQLNEEVAQLKRPPWVDEGLAAYFAASRVHDGKIQLGDVDRAAYPIWWLPSLPLSGDLDADIASGTFIPLPALIASTRIDIGKSVNLHYIEYWSLTHFLLHAQDGKYSEGYRRLIAAGGSNADFARLIGPIDRIQTEWYGYLQDQVGSLGRAGGGEQFNVVDDPDEQWLHSLKPTDPTPLSNHPPAAH